MHLEFDAGGDDVSYVLQAHLKGGGCLQYVMPLAAADRIIRAFGEWKRAPDPGKSLALLTKNFATESGASEASCGLIDFAQVAGMCLGVPPPPVQNLCSREEREYYQMACAYLAAKIDSLTEGDEWRNGPSDDDEDPDEDDGVDIEFYEGDDEEEDE